MKYVLISDNLQDKFEAKVNQALQNGAQLIGGVALQISESGWIIAIYQAVLYP